MQLLHTVTTACGSPNRCAGSLTNVMPEVMWFVRHQMAQQRPKVLSVPQVRTLAMLSRFDRVSLSEVAENLGSSLPTASRMVSGLVKRGFASRKDCRDDRRQVQIQISPKGQEALKQALETTEKAMAERLKTLSDEQQQTLGAALDLLHQLFGPTRAAAAAPPTREG